MKSLKVVWNITGVGLVKMKYTTSIYNFGLDLMYSFYSKIVSTLLYLIVHIFNLGRWGVILWIETA